MEDSRLRGALDAQKARIDKLGEDLDREASSLRDAIERLRNQSNLQQSDMSELERTKIRREFRQAVNMSANELREWAENPCSRLASLSRDPIDRNLELLETPMVEWSPKHYEWAQKTIGYVARAKEQGKGEPAAEGCPSKNTIALRNWARHDLADYRGAAIVLGAYDPLLDALEQQINARLIADPNCVVAGDRGETWRLVSSEITPASLDEAIAAEVEKVCSQLDGWEDLESRQREIIQHVVTLPHLGGDVAEALALASVLVKSILEGEADDGQTKGFDGVGGDLGAAGVLRSGDAVDEGASTPAEPEERIEGSEKNEPGSASGRRGGIELSEAIEEGILNKVEAHNEEHGDDPAKRADLGALKAVARRAAGAFSSTHRPGVNRQQWMYGRVDAFLYLLRNGKPEKAAYTSDDDLLPEGHPKAPNKDGDRVRYRTSYRGLNLGVQYEPNQERNSREMPCYYGTIAGHVGEDRMALDFLGGPYLFEPDRGGIYLVSQNHSDTGEFDQSKVMLGFDSTEAAEKAYRLFAPFEQSFGGIKEIQIADLEVFRRNKDALTEEGKIAVAEPVLPEREYGTPSPEAMATEAVQEWKATASEGFENLLEARTIETEPNN